ncbi:hypothetical protein BAUCODRAFT_206168 [Baudoinia panamericana UAMH 10762]|uniref:PQ-loop-domain-containing protein n=1 Tax=Baudoinia panamericana (strain UAMH 10762) TaxID=717646 RepID=M2N4S7_BAUPA|nr:uncharacterized protein BAUCODRAFT_206168 [Baudoinia panamericana UAMH 10762]EMC93755.1 hypothetical protein BAUCODRAFT_206168 [Baudoinia panamericana UAMH 10762]
MALSTVSYDLDVEAISGICGSISIACWVVVFSPQIIENFRRSSAEGLSVEFVIIWLLGDVFNILGAVLQGVLPTMIILAIYYTFADVVLLGQCFYYRGFTLRDPKPEPVTSTNGLPNERTPLVQNGHMPDWSMPQRPPTASDIEPTSRHRSRSPLMERFASLDGTHMSPAVPMHKQPKQANDLEAMKPKPSRTWLQACLFNGTAIILVIAAGVAGYYLSPSSPSPDRHQQTEADEQAESLHFSLWGQIFGYICAILYLGSRIPQLLLNYRRKSTDGLNVLFFLFACFGNLTFVLSIFAFEPICSKYSHGHWHRSSCRPGQASEIYGRYILVNASWLIGSLGTLFLDGGVFVQFWMYRGNVPSDSGQRTAVAGEARGREADQR